MIIIITIGQRKLESLKINGCAECCGLHILFNLIVFIFVPKQMAREFGYTLIDLEHTSISLSVRG